MRLLIALLAVGCTVPAPSRTFQPPAAFDGATAGADARGMWWRSFGDAHLDGLVERALRGNHSLEAAWARIEQARALARVAGADRWPSLEARADGALGGRGRSTDASGSLALAASYEIDLWGRLRSTQRAAVLDAVAFRDDADALAMTIASEVVDAWFTWTSAREQVTSLDGLVVLEEKRLDLITERVTAGRSPDVERSEQLRQIATTRSRREQAMLAAEVSRHRLALLVGVRAGELGLSPGIELPQLPATPSTGLPADLLLVRPDVRAASRRLAAADQRVASAVAARLPRLTLGADGGVALGPATILWNVIGSLVAPVLDGGRRRAEVARTKAVVDERLADLSQALLVAIVEVERASASERLQRGVVKAVDERVAASALALEQVQARYGGGMADLLPVIIAEEAQVEAVLAQIEARRQALAFRVELHRALGGSWGS